MLSRRAPPISIATHGAGAAQCPSRVDGQSDPRAITRGAGLRIRSGSSGSFLVGTTALDLPSSIAETLAPLQRVIAVLNEELATADDRCATIASQDPVVARLTTVPSVGPIAATAYVAAWAELRPPIGNLTGRFLKCPITPPSRFMSTDVLRSRERATQGGPFGSTRPGVFRIRIELLVGTAAQERWPGRFMVKLRIVGPERQPTWDGTATHRTKLQCLCASIRVKIDRDSRSAIFRTNQ